MSSVSTERMCAEREGDSKRTYKQKRRVVECKVTIKGNSNSKCLNGGRYRDGRPSDIDRRDCGSERERERELCISCIYKKVFFFTMLLTTTTDIEHKVHPPRDFHFSHFRVGFSCWKAWAQIKLGLTKTMINNHHHHHHHHWFIGNR